MFKRVFCVILILVSMFVLFGCSSETANGSGREDKTELSGIDKAKAMIGEGKIEEAYTLLYEMGDDPEAKKLREDFLIVHKEYKVTHPDASETHYITYDKNGNAIKDVDSDGNVIYERTYDENNNLLMDKQYLENGGSETRKYEYDKNGKLYQSYFYDVNNVEYLSFQRTYDTNGNIITQKGEEYITEYTYDSAGRIVKEVETSEGVVRVIENVYNADGRIVKSTFSVDDTYSNTTQYSYDESGNLIYKLQEDSDGEKIEYEYAYNKNNLLLMEKCKSNDYYSEELLSYDAKSRMTKYVILNEDGVVHTTVVTYDDTNNTAYFEFLTNDQDDTYEKIWYDKNGNVIKRETSDFEGSGEKRIDEYSGYMYFYRPDLKDKEDLLLEYNDQLNYFDLQKTLII